MAVLVALILGLLVNQSSQNSFLPYNSKTNQVEVTDESRHNFIVTQVDPTTYKDCVSCVVNNLNWLAGNQCSSTIAEGAATTVQNCLQQFPSVSNQMMLQVNTQNPLAFKKGLFDQAYTTAAESSVSIIVSNMLPQSGQNLMINFGCPTTGFTKCSYQIADNQQSLGSTLTDFQTLSKTVLSENMYMLIVVFSNAASSSSLQVSLTAFDQFAITCVACVLGHPGYYWNPDSFCTPAMYLAMSSNTITQCIQNNQQPLQQNTMSIAKTLAFSAGKFSGQFDSVAANQEMATITNNLDKSISLVLTLGSGVQAFMGMGPATTPGFALTPYTSTNMQSVGQGEQIIFVFYNGQGVIGTIPYQVQLTTFSTDCVTCVSNKMMWNPGSLCSNSAYNAQTDISTVQQCIQKNELPTTQQSFMIDYQNTFAQGMYSNSIRFTTSESMKDSYTSIQNTFNKPFSLMLSAQALNIPNPNPSPNPAPPATTADLMIWYGTMAAGGDMTTVQIKPYTNAMNIKLMPSDYLYVVLYAPSGAYDITYQVTLDSQFPDCVSCVASGSSMMWSASTLCSPLSGFASWNTMNQQSVQSCVQSLQTPLTVQYYDIDQYKLTFQKAVSQVSNFVVNAAIAQAIIVKISNSMAKGGDLKITLPAGVTAWYGQGIVSSQSTVAQYTSTAPIVQPLSDKSNAFVILYATSGSPAVSFQIALVPGAPDCIACVAQKMIWNSQILCASSYGESPNNYDTMSECIQAGQLPQGGISNQYVASKNFVYTKGSSQSSIKVIGQTSSVNEFTNDLLYPITINFVYEAPNMMVWTGLGKLPTMNIIMEQQLNNTQTTLAPGTTGVLVTFSEFQTISLQINQAIAKQQFDCVYCAQNKMFWSVDTFCTATSPSTSNPIITTVQMCLSSGEVPFVQQTVNVDTQLAFTNGINNLMFYVLDQTTSDVIIYFTNTWDKPVTVALTFDTGLTAWYGKVTNNMIPISATYATNNPIQMMNEGDVYAFVFFGKGTFKISYTISLQKGASDCVSCVAKGMNNQWNANTFCSAKIAGIATVPDCIKNNLSPPITYIQVDTTLNYAAGMYQETYDLISTQNTDVFLEIPNGVMKPFTVTINCPSTGVVVYYGVGSSQGSTFDTMLQPFSCTNSQMITVNSDQKANIIMDSIDGMQKATVTIQLSSQSSINNCVQCVESGYKWNQKTLCSQGFGNQYSVPLCINNNQLSNENIYPIQLNTMKYSRGMATAQVDLNQGQYVVFSAQNPFEIELSVSIQCDSMSASIFTGMGTTAALAQSTVQDFACNTKLIVPSMSYGLILIYAKQVLSGTNIQISLQDSNCISCVAAKLNWSPSTLCSKNPVTDSFSTVQQCIIAGENPQSKQALPIAYSLPFSEAAYSQTYTLITGNQESIGIRLENVLGKPVNFTLNCYGMNTLSSWQGVGNTDQNAQALLNTYGCNMPITLQPGQIGIVIVYSQKTLSFDIQLMASSLASDCVSCTQMGLNWSSNFKCSFNFGQYDSVQSCVTDNLLPPMASQTAQSINPMTHLTNNMVTYTYSLSAGKMQDVMITLNNTVYDHFTVTLTCDSTTTTFGSTGAGAKISTTTFKKYKCNDYFVLGTNQTNYILLSTSSMVPVNVNVVIEILNPNDCVSCVSNQHYWNLNKLCSNTTGNTSMSTVSQCLISNQTPVPTVVTLAEASFAAPVTYSYDLTMKNDDMFLMVPNELTKSMIIQLICSTPVNMYSVVGNSATLSGYIPFSYGCGSTYTLAQGYQAAFVVYANSTAQLNFTMSPGSNSTYLLVGLGAIFATLIAFLF